MSAAGERFRRIALSMPGASEHEHMGHPDFRVDKKIFATLFWRDEEVGMVKLTPEQQRQVVRKDPDAFQPVTGGWGRTGCTEVRLDNVTAAALRPVIETAWRNITGGEVRNDRASKSRAAHQAPARKEKPAKRRP